MELLHWHLINTSNTRCQCNNSMHNLIMYLIHRGILFLWLWILSITIVQEDCHFYLSVSCGQAAAGLCFYQLVLDVMGARNWVIVSCKAQLLTLLFCSLLYAGSHRSHPKRRVLHTVLTLLEASPPLNARNFSEA
ncbi:unnamed protein product [Sphagnum troendelagicum]|uniref:Uncharacterized protein n=1 Tax=Sphagnum troendelagicum TaxID=128251 RepID=A0ABP0TYI3_9BRYO